MSSTERPKAWSLGGTLILWFVVASSGIVLLTTGMAWFALFNGMAWRDDLVLETRADSIRDVLVKGVLDVAELDREVNEDLEGPRQLLVRVVGPNGIGTHETRGFPAGLTPQTFSGPGGEPIGRLLQKRIRIGDREYLAAIEHVPVSTSAGRSVASIIMALDTRADLQVIDRYTLLIVLIALIGVFLSIVVGRIIIGVQLRPLEQLKEQTARIDRSTLDHRIHVPDLPAELNSFVCQFNDMMGRLEKAYTGLRRYADDVAHELRTPLNRIQLGFEVALSEDRSADAYRQALETTFQECAHLSTLVRSLLFIAAAEHGATRIDAERFNLHNRLSKILDFFSVDAAEKGVRLELDCPADMEMAGDPTLVQRAVVNLVSNALSHTPEGGRVSIAARQAGAGVEIDVNDTGEGIAPEDLPHVFDRFFHRESASSASRDRGRLGLGLAITKSIVDLHGGQVRLDSKRSAGTRFTLSFPDLAISSAA